MRALYDSCYFINGNLGLIRILFSACSESDESGGGETCLGRRKMTWKSKGWMGGLCVCASRKQWYLIAVGELQAKSPGSESSGHYGKCHWYGRFLQPQEVNMGGSAGYSHGVAHAVMLCCGRRGSTVQPWDLSAVSSFLYKYILSALCK